MAHDRAETDRPALPWTPWFVLVLALALTGAATVYVSSTTRQTEELRFGRWVRQTVNDVRDHLDTYVALLRGSAAFVSASEVITRREFRTYVDRLRLDELYPGMQGVGWTQRVPVEACPAFEEEMRRQGAIEFRVWPETSTDEHYTVAFLEPEDRRNLRAIGFDMGTEPSRREAMDRAADTGWPAATGIVTLVQEIDPHKQAGFIIYVPVYEGGDIPPTVEERRQRLRGFVYSAFRAGDLLEHVFDPNILSLIGVRIYDTEEPGDATFLYRTTPESSTDAEFTTSVTLGVSGRPWTLVFHSRRAFERQMQSSMMAPLTLAGGLLLSLLLFGVTLGLTNARLRAEDAVADLRRSEQALRESDDRLRLALNAADLCAYAVDLSTQSIDHVGDMKRILGVDVNTTAEFVEHVHPDDRLNYERSLARAIAGEDPHELEFRVTDTAGQIHWVRDRAVVEFDAGGTADRLTGVCAEITRQKNTEHMLRQLNETLEQRVADRTLEAEQRSAQLRALAAELTQAEQRERRRLAQVLHDHLQQLLVASLMRLNGLQRKADDRLTPPLEQVEDLIRQAITASRSLTVELSPPVLYDAGLGRALEWLARSMKDKHQLNVELVGGEDHPSVSEDLRAFLFQAVRELLFNVVKHAGVHDARVVMLHDERRLRITVEDGGPGFDPSVLRVQGAKAEHFGLFSIQQRLELLGGRLDVDSQPGAGTRITLEVPIDNTPTTGPHVSEILSDLPESDQHLYAEKLLSSYMPATGPVRVLLIDGREALRQSLGAVLHAQPDIELVGEASDREEAVRLSAALKPDVVVMEVPTSRLEATAATRRILDATPETRVIGLSNQDDGQHAEAMKAAGAYDLALKAEPPEDLLTLIRKAATDRTVA